MEVRLRGALLGAGNAALRAHVPQWLKRTDAEIVAVADISPKNRELARSLFPGATIYETAEDLLAIEDVDFCDVCTPPFTRVPIVEEAVGRGIHILAEKPIAASLVDAERIAALVRASGVVFKPCHQYRHSPLWKTVQALVPRIGHIRMARYEVRRPAANDGNPNWRPQWRTDRALSGGGILVDHGAHVLYQLRQIMGEATRVRASVRTLRHREYLVEDTAFLLLEMPNAVAEVTLSWAAHRRETCFRLVGEHGEIVGGEDEVRLWTSTEETVFRPEGLSADSSHSGWYEPLFDEFVDQVRTGRSIPEDMDEAVYVARVIESAYASSESERALPLALPGVTAPAEARSPEAAVTDVQEPVLVAAGGAPPSRGRRAARAALRGVALTALLAAVGWMLHDVAWGGVWSVLATAKPAWIAAAIAVNMGVLVFQAARWLALVRPLAPGATLLGALKAMIVGFSVSAVVPARGGEIARVETFGRQTGLPRMVVMGSVLLDTLVNASVLLLGAALLPIFVKVPLWLRPGGWVALGLFSVGAVIVFALRPIRQASGAARAGILAVGGGGVRALLSQVRQGVVASADPKALAYSFSASLVAWTLEVNVATLSLRAVGLTLPLASTLLVLLAVNIALAVPVATPANLGTLEIGAMLALVELGVTKERALAFAVCYHLLQIVPIVAIGLLIGLRGFVRGNAGARR